MKKIIVGLSFVLIILGGAFFLNINQRYVLVGKNEEIPVAKPVVADTIIGTIIHDQPKDFKKVEYVYESLDPIIAKIKAEVTNAEIITERTEYLGRINFIESQGRLIAHEGEYKLTQGTAFGEKLDTQSSATPIIISAAMAQEKMVTVGDTFEEVLTLVYEKTSAKKAEIDAELKHEFVVQGIFGAMDGVFYMPTAFIGSDGFNQISEKVEAFEKEQRLEEHAEDYSATYYSFATEAEYQTFIETYTPQLPQYYKFSRLRAKEEPKWETIVENKLSYQSSGMHYTDSIPTENGNTRTCSEKNATEMKLRNDSSEPLTLTPDSFYYEYGTERIVLENELTVGIDGVEKLLQSNLPKTLAPGEEVIVQILHQATIEGRTYGVDDPFEDRMTVDVSFFYTDGNQIVQLEGEAVTGVENLASCNAVEKA